MFIYGTNDFGELWKRCNVDGKDGCKCWCETSSSEGECNEVDHNGYRLYKYLEKGKDQNLLNVSYTINI